MPPTIPPLTPTLTQQRACIQSLAYFFNGRFIAPDVPSSHHGSHHEKDNNRNECQEQPTAKSKQLWWNDLRMPWLLEGRLSGSWIL